MSVDYAKKNEQTKKIKMAETRISGALVFDGIYGDLARVGLPIPLVVSLHSKNLTLEGAMWNVRCFRLVCSGLLEAR